MSARNSRIRPKQKFGEHWRTVACVTPFLFCHHFHPQAMAKKSLCVLPPRIAMKLFLSSLLFIAFAQVTAFQLAGTTLSGPSRGTSSLAASILQLPKTTTEERISEIRKYEFEGWNLTYRYKAASRGYENADPILLIHPVGIGLASWFWERFMAEWIGPAMYAPNLIGCGISEGGDAWDPDEKGLSFPLSWARGCEVLLRSSEPSSVIPGISFFGATKSRKWTVMSQGGLAPVAVQLASRNPTIIDKLILASPPTWRDMTTPIPEAELSRNYNFFRSPIWGRLAFQVLESRGAIEFFSNKFLFSKPCDSKWLDSAEKELGLKARPPVMAFNSGFCLHRSLDEEIVSLSQSTLILAGAGDKRQRDEYMQFMKNCSLQVLPGLNVLPWESPVETVGAVKAFLKV